MKLKLAITSMLLFTGSVFAIDRLSDQDRQFIDAALRLNQSEIEEGVLAARQAYGPDVRKYGDRMVLDHKGSLSQLQTIAAKYGVNLPVNISAINAVRIGELQKFSALTGVDFDEQYIARQLKAHEQLIVIYQKEANEGRSASLRRYATNTLQHLQRHMDMARTLEVRIATGDPRARPQEVKSNANPNVYRRY